MQWFGKPVPYSRFLGQVDQDDPTNLPNGLAALCLNTDFTRDSPGVTCANTRAGNNLTMQGLAQAAITGLVGFTYSPRFASESFFQMPILFDAAGNLQRESPVGSGHTRLIPGGALFTPPANAHMLAVSAANKVWMAFTDLTAPASGCACFDPTTLALNPFGMKPVGWNWQAGTYVLAGEVCTPAAPSTGNGHTYQAQNSGWTGAAEPVWPLVEGGTVAEVVAGGKTPVVWKEHTMVMANKLSPPPAPLLSQAGGGAFAANLDVYAVVTLLNAQGETTPSPAAFITTLILNTLVNVQIPALGALPGWMQTLAAPYIPTQARLYVASVAHGAAAPPLNAYRMLGGAVPLGTLVPVSSIPVASNTEYFGASTSASVNALFSNGGQGTQYGSPVISGFASVAAGGNYVYLTIQINGTIAVVGGGGGGVEVDVSIDSGATWNSIYGFGGTGMPSTWVTAALPFFPANINTVQVRLKAMGGAAPAGSVSISASITDAYLTVVPAGTPQILGVTPPVSNTARTTPGGLFTPTTMPVIARAPAAGFFAAGKDVYVAITYTNSLGETTLGPVNSIVATAANDGVQVTVAVPQGDNGQVLFPIVSVGVYEASVATGTPAPASALFQLVGYFSAGNTPLITQDASGANAPLVNTTGPGGAIQADTATGGANGGQGYRYAACMFVNQNETFSGFTLASVIQYAVDEDGWELGVYNIPMGPANVVGRVIPLTIADARQTGSFWWLGLIDLLVPAQNVVYPATTLVDQVQQSSTALLDNVSTQAIFNFTDSFLQSGNLVNDRLRLIAPPQACRMDYLPSVDRLALSGVPGYYSGGLFSLGADYESFYGDTSPLPFPPDGQRCYGFTDAYKGVIFAMRSKSGYVVEPTTGDPATWGVRKRWSDVGPCGPRAWDANGKMIVFVDRTGLYKYDESDPDLMSKEIPRRWGTINWAAAAAAICVTIDEDTHTVRVQVPTGQSTQNNEEFCLSYLEGWQNPIHYSTYSGKEISMDAARRWSFNTGVQANLCLRMERKLPAAPQLLDGPDWTALADSSFWISQLLYGSSGPDGGVNARTPGIYSDNGAGIDWQWESVSSGMMQAMCKAEGFNLNAVGQGTIYASFLAARDMATGPDGNWPELRTRDIALDLAQRAGITRKVPTRTNEYWRVRFTNGKLAGAWCSLKNMTVYLIPVTAGRNVSDRSR